MHHVDINKISASQDHGPLRPMFLNSLHMELFSENIVFIDISAFLHTAGLILDLRPASERRHYKVTPSLIGWAQT